MHRFIIVLAFIVAILPALVACSSEAGAEYLELGTGATIDLEVLGLDEDVPQTGRILVWHDWPEPESDLLDELISSYMKLFPGVHVVVKYVPANQILSRYEEQVASGLRPDLLLGIEAHHLSRFAIDGFILDLAEHDFESLHIQEKALDALRLGDRLYGIPLSGFTDVMYFNKRHVTEPITDLDQMVSIAHDDHRICIPLDFFDAYWGVDAFNGTIFGDDAQVAPEEGFITWLAWVVQAQNESNILFDTDYAELREVFLNGELDYFIGSSHELPYFQERLSKEYLGVATLPGAINAEPGAFLEIEALAVNRYSAEVDLSIALIRFLTNVPIQRRISHSGLGRIPLNSDVIIDERISPIEAALVSQEKRAVIIPFRLANVQNHLFHLGDESYDSVLHGVITPHEAAEQLRVDLQN